MKNIERDSPEWHRLWETLASALVFTLLPENKGINIKNSIDDFMLMGVTDDGRAHFKHIMTRNYIFLLPDGTIEIPSPVNLTYCKIINP